MFSKVGEYDAAGLFSTAHIISIIVCFVLIVTIAILTRKMTKKTYFKLLKIFTIIATILEIIKILLTWHEGRRDLNAWLPMFFCSLFIYSLWLTWFKNEFIKDFGLSYIAFAGIVSGLAFIIFPTTSFTWYPIFHFKCLHSMIYHSMMVYAGVMLYVTKSYKIDLKAVLKYSIFCLSFMIFALVLNHNFDSNFMFISNPGIVPLPFLHTIYDYSPILFTISMMFAHIVLMGFGMYGIVKLVKYLKNKHKSRTVELAEEIEHKTI